MTDTQPKNPRRPAREALLEIEGLSVSFELPHGTVQAVKDVSFAVNPGETLALVGESGSGKSVTSTAAMRLLPELARAEGVIRFKGEELLGATAKRMRRIRGGNIAMIFQEPMTSLNPLHRIGDQIKEVLDRHQSLKGRAATAKAIDLLEQVGVPEPAKRVDQYPHELSGGLRQRVVIAMALACEPSLLIADEPTTAVDVTVQKRLLDLLDGLRRDRGMSMILITHDLGVARGRCDDVAVMYGGRLVERAPTETLFADSRHPYTEALLRTIPRIDQPSHTRLEPIAGRPPELIDPDEECAFAPRCRYAQPDCLEAIPPVGGVRGQHEFACFHPANTDRGRQALDANLAAGQTVTGLQIQADAGVN